MGYVTIWIEGDKNLKEFCQRRFQAKPQFRGTIGSCGDATVYHIYKRKADGEYADMYLLAMKHPNGDVYDLTAKQRETYEEIRTYKHSILK